MYPTVLKEARKHTNKAVIRTFAGAMEVRRPREATPRRSRCSNREEGLLGRGSARDFFVFCPACGYTSKHLDAEELCPVCRCSQERFEAVQ